MKKILATIFLLAILSMALTPMTVVASRGTAIKLSAVSSAPRKSIVGPLPDLTLSPEDIGFTPSEPLAGDTVTITATIHNIGEVQALPAEVGFYDNVTGLIGIGKAGLIKAGRTGIASIKWVAAAVGNHNITVVVDPNKKISESNETNNEASKTIAILEAAPPPPASTPPAIEYALFIEIDYMEGHKPNSTALAYIRGYYYDRGISVTFYVNDTVPYDPSVTDAEFWTMEARYNNMGDDSAGGNPETGIYFSKWKWVLYGTNVSGYPNIVGYCYIVAQSVSFGEWDLLAGNYMFLADNTADCWAVSRGIEPYGAETVVLMHEIGHCIGIAIVDSWGREVYCRNIECVMARLSVYNADNYHFWHYCNDHWATKNLEYYAI